VVLVAGQGIPFGAEARNDDLKGRGSDDIFKRGGVRYLQIYGPIKCDSDRRDWDFDMDRSEREAWDIGWSIQIF